MATGGVAEFFSGVGGWSFALARAHERNQNIQYPTHVTALEINVNANKVYTKNFQDHSLLCKDIRYIKLDQFVKLKANTWVLSPPCQPYTTLGKQLESKDNRAGALHHLCNILKQMSPEQQPNFICFENVPGFQQSDSRQLWISCLQETGYFFQEFLLSPNQFSIPNERLRYFCAARKVPWNFNTGENILHTIPGVDLNPQPTVKDSAFYNTNQDYLEENESRSTNYYAHCQPVSDFLERVDWESGSCIPESFTKKCTGYKHDIVTSSCRRSSCFTSGYTSTARGAGSLLLHSANFSESNRSLLPQITPEIILEGKIRFFSPREVANLMGFPESFIMDEEISQKTWYKLLGNSINVECASRVIEFLLTGIVE